MTILIFFLVITNSAQGQVNDAEIRQQVLERSLVDSIFIFGKWEESGETETHLKYLGEVTMTDGRVFKLMTSCWFWGLSKRATSRILIYNDNNQFVGNYALGMTNELPDKLENGYLVFTNTDNPDCDKKLITRVNFTKGLPKEMFIRCEGDFGDRYTFSTD